VIIAVNFADGLSSGYFCYISGLELKITQYIMLSVALDLGSLDISKVSLLLLFAGRQYAVLTGQLDIKWSVQHLLTTLTKNNSHKSIFNCCNFYLWCCKVSSNKVHANIDVHHHFEKGTVVLTSHSILLSKFQVSEHFSCPGSLAFTYSSIDCLSTCSQWRSFNHLLLACYFCCTGG